MNKTLALAMEHISIEAPLGDHGGDFERKTFITGDSRRYEKTVLRTNISFHRGPNGEPRGGLVYGGL
jgi:hypothetical protein